VPILGGHQPGVSFPEFVSHLGRYLDRRVVLGKVEGLPAQVTCQEHGLGWPITPEAWESDHALGQVLKHVAEQTGLTAREETRRVRVLTVERMKEPPAVESVPAGRANAGKAPPRDMVVSQWRDDPLYQASQALVGWWPGDGHLFDLAGAHHGARQGPVAFAQGRCGAAFSFPDGKGFVTVSRPAALVNTFTFAAWVNPTATRAATAERLDPVAGIRGQNYAIYPTYGKDMAGPGISVRSNGHPDFEPPHNNCPCALAYDTPVKGWTHVAVGYAQGRPTLYVNGEAVKTGVRSAWTIFPGTYFGDPSSGYGPYQGLLDEAMLFDRALSGAEIR